VFVPAGARLLELRCVEAPHPATLIASPAQTIAADARSRMWRHRSRMWRHVSDTPGQARPIDAGRSADTAPSTVTGDAAGLGLALPVL
jgi:hypothetical protein